MLKLEIQTEYKATPTQISCYTIAGIVKKPEEYEWSSYRYYTINEKAPEWLESNFILGYF